MGAAVFWKGFRAMGYEYEIHDGDEYFASSWSRDSDHNAFMGAMHYLAQCETPRLYRVMRELVEFKL